MTEDDEAKRVAATIDRAHRRERLCTWVGAIGLGVSALALGGSIAYAALVVGNWLLAGVIAFGVVLRFVADMANINARQHRQAKWDFAIRQRKG